ncbi:NAD(P)-dependent oxidoreductase [Lactobacillus sp. CBA3606]|uniref:Gfo/Idh/MocA family protein n=1 Tax=Lactobacillus sp. CBA3606 TaxID=2099789 RepID=UPI000CFD9EFB|nr:Gfo/Idh/MocA family oxidoreductase [Lactobacillus sp. CBA3606]AVK63508.1 NAD(P)-dependent oxidoreductase [Lactobacillus sp. CBA3606]
MHLGLIGTGMIVQDMLTMIGDLPAIKLEGILSTPHSVDRAQKLQGTYGIKHVYTDYDELLANPAIDTVYVALPNVLHYQFTKQALQQEKNVICEKPFTLAASQLDELIALAQSRDLVLVEAITTQYLANYQGIKANLAKLGDLKVIECNYSQYSSRYDRFKAGIVLPAFDPKMGGGALMDLNIYNIHFVVGLLGAPTAVKYLANLDRGIDTSGMLILTYPTTKVVCIGAKDCTAPIQSTIQGTDGSIVVAGPTNTVASYTTTLRATAATTVNQNQHAHRMFAEFAEFDRMITTHDMPRVRQQLAHSQQVMAVVDQALSSAELTLG